MAWPDTIGAAQHGTGASIAKLAQPDEYLQKRFLEELFKDYIMWPLGLKGDLPGGNGVTVTWNKFTKHTVTITNNTEGDVGYRTTFTTTTVQATLAEYIAFADYSELLDMSSITGTIERMARNLGYKMAMTLDYLCCTVIDAATNNNDAGTAMTAEEVRKAAQELSTLAVPHHSATPGGAFYVMPMTPEQFYDMIGEGAPTWVQAKRDELTRALTQPWQDTAATSAIYDVMIKKASGMLAISSEDYAPCMGDGAFGCIAMGPGIAYNREFSGAAPGLIWTRPSENTAIPGRNRGTVAAKAYAAVTLLDQSQVCVVKSDVT